MTGQYIYDHVDIKTPDGTITLRRDEKGKKEEKPKKGFDDPLPKRNLPRDMPPNGPTGSVPKARGDDKLAGRQGKGKIGDKNVTIKFTDKRTFTITGDMEDTGTYTPTLNFVRMVTKRGSVFFGTIDGDTISGSVTIKSPEGKPKQQRWSIDLMKSGAQSDAADKPVTNVASMRGKWIVNRGDVRFEYNFKDDKTFDLRVTSRYFNSFKQGRWEQKENTVSAWFQESGAPGTSGFTRARELTVKILSSNKMEIDGYTATRK